MKNYNGKWETYSPLRVVLAFRDSRVLRLVHWVLLTTGSVSTNTSAQVFFSGSTFLLDIKNEYLL